MPSNVKRLHGVRQSRINDAEPMPREVEPEPPDWAPEAWLAIWNRLRSELRGMGLWLAADQDALVALVTTIHEYDRIAKVLVNAPAVVRSTDGSPEANPLGRALRQLSAEVARWCSHFGLTPAERSRLSRPLERVNPWEHDDLDGRNYS